MATSNSNPDSSQLRATQPYIISPPTVSFDFNGKRSVVPSAQQPAEVSAVPHPELPGIDFIILQFRDASEYLCGVSRDVGVHETPDGTSIRYAKLVDGGYDYKTSQGDTEVHVRVYGNDVYGTNDKGVFGKLSDNQAQIFVEALKTERDTCARLLREVIDTVGPAVGGLRPGTDVNFDSTAMIKKIQIVGSPAAGPA